MNWEKIRKTLGPGILFASTAIGVSHLVQSTRAGANYGFALLIFIIAANVLKFPFFEFAARYASATGETLIDGYKKLGKFAIWLYFIITICSMFFVSAAVVLVTAGFMDNLFGLSELWSHFQLFPVALVFVVTVGLLLSGKFNFLDHLIKIIGTTLLVSTLVVFIMTLLKGPATHVPDFTPPAIFEETSLLFIIALMGWMPTALDMSTWVSLWAVEKMRSTNYHPSLKESLIDFNLGYWISAFLSVCFVTLGAYLIYGTGRSLPTGSVGFADSVIKLYTTTMGNWSYIIIGTAAFSIMFGTCIGLFDGYARTLERTTTLIFAKKSQHIKNSRTVYIWSLVLLALGSFSINAFFSGQFKTLIDLATTISFLIAPLVAIANFKLVSKTYIAKPFVPGKLMTFISYLGIVFLTGFAMFYIYVMFL
ncbi:NRAMP family divalent metal transporter [Aestuariivivens sediminicola]|uniref:NRAMP family divalent metal transporter n=1 Tax=Aestuariivivens sediminicola TaxID=2913560 RepID=UPI001F57F21D|nr:divalent metal cation transporter [Aestuariivivens sediminicola]